jgi:hypothetical protein
MPRKEIRMRISRRTALVATLLLVVGALPLRAQSAADPSGHWEGAVQAPGMTVAVEVDLARNARGELIGTFGQPQQNLKGLPLSNVSVEGTSVSFQVGNVPGERTFRGTLGADGKSLSGDYASPVVGTVAFNLVRTGDARMEMRPKTAAVAKELEGTWEGRLDVDGGLRLVLTMTNQPDGTSVARIMNVDQGRLEVPVSAITQSSSQLTLEIAAVGGSWAGTINKDGTELTGTYSQGPLTMPLTFKRAAGERK